MTDSPTPTMETSDIEKYCALMEEVKRRTEVIDALAAGRSPLLYRPPTVESIYLQFRKVLELIAMGSLVANKHALSRARADFAKQWHAERILKDIARINPFFYPQPIVEIPSAVPGIKMHWEDLKEGYLTRDDFADLYNKCGSVLHSPNPYGKKLDYLALESEIPRWRQGIIQLLNSHKIQLVSDPDTLYLVHMSEET